MHCWYHGFGPSSCAYGVRGNWHVKSAAPIARDPKSEILSLTSLCFSSSFFVFWVAAHDAKELLKLRKAIVINTDLRITIA